VRDDIADCSSAAYATLPVPAALAMLKLEGGAPALLSYAAARGLAWRVERDTLVFAPADKARAAIDAPALMANVLDYANELERIV
jgi:hypothetical protein